MTVDIVDKLAFLCCLQLTRSLKSPINSMLEFCILLRVYAGHSSYINIRVVALAVNSRAKARAA